MDFLQHFEHLKDDRSDINREYDVIDIIFLTMAALLSGAKGWKDVELFGRAKLDWLRQYRPFPNEIPTRHSIGRIIRSIKADSVIDCFEQWITTQRQQQGQEHIAFDGKVLRGSRQSRLDNSFNALQLMTAMVVESGLILTQKETPDKRNEIGTMQAMLKDLAVKGAIITADALHCQRKTVDMIRQEDADYIVQIKGNQKKLQQDVQAFFQHTKQTKPDDYKQYTFSEIDGEHGRIVQRHYRLLPITDWLIETEKWTDSHALIEVTREREIKGKKSQEIAYYMTSSKHDIAVLSRVIRNHWSIENSQHWILDVTLGEDSSTIYAGDGAKNMALFRRAILNLIKQHPLKDSVAGKMMRAGWDDKFRAEILFGQKMTKV